LPTNLLVKCLDKGSKEYYTNQNVGNQSVGIINSEKRIRIMAALKNKYGPWVSGDDFFDREAEVRLLTELIDEGNNTLIVAPRRVGKTSLVQETFRRMEERRGDYLLYAPDGHPKYPTCGHFKMPHPSRVIFQ